jgi:hypothetical protein
MEEKEGGEKRERSMKKNKGIVMPVYIFVDT